MWPNRRDEPFSYPWAIWPEWTFALLSDLFRRSEQPDLEYLGYRGHVRWGAVLIVIGFAGFALLARLSEH
jgi:hypothetical protein